MSLEKREARHSEAGLPSLWLGIRRRYLTQLVSVGIGQAVLAGIAAHALVRALHQARPATVVGLCGLLAACALMVGLLRVLERVLAEKLSQDYVHDVRMSLLRQILTEGSLRSLGVVVTRTSNDLTAVKNWVALGVAPLVVGIPLLVGAGVALAVLSLALAIGLLVPVAMFAVAVVLLVGPMFARSRRVRHVRGRLSGHIGDAAIAITAIRSAGGAERELGRLERLSRDLVAAQVERARFAGLLRGAAAAATGLATAGVVAASATASVSPSVVAGALSLVGFVAAPIHDLGRVAEYRQAYRAARRIIAPQMSRPPSPGATGIAGSGAPDGVVIVDGLRVADGSSLPTFVALPGDRVVLDLGDRYLESAALQHFAGLASPDPGQLIVSGIDLAAATDRQRRRLVGYGAQGMLLARGSIMRTAKYRVPSASDDEVAALLRQVGLASRVTELPSATRTMLVHGGAPLGVGDRARLILVRSLLGAPPLIVLDRLDSDLGPLGRKAMRELLVDYPGVVLLASDQPEAVVEPTYRWGHPDVFGGAPAVNRPMPRVRPVQESDGFCDAAEANAFSVGPEPGD